MIRRSLIVMRKEVRDAARDRRSWATSVLLAVLGPLLLVAVIEQVSTLAAREPDRPLSLPVVGAPRAPALVAFLVDHGVVVAPPPSAPDRSVVDGAHDVVLVIPEAYADALTAGDPAPLRVVFDESRPPSAAAARRLRDLLNAHGAQIAAARLLARGVSPAVVRPLAVESRNLSTPQGKAAKVLVIVPMFLLLSVFAGGLAVAIDVTAGERERGSLEPLLATPASAGELLTGKLAAVTCFAWVSLVVTAAAFATVLALVPLDVPGMRVSLAPSTALWALLLFSPLAPLSAAIQMLGVSTRRSFKEAQTVAQLLVLLPMLPGMAALFVTGHPPRWAAWVPYWGQQLLLDRLMRGDGSVGVDLVASLAVTTLGAGAIHAVTVARYRRERVLFG